MRQLKSSAVATLRMFKDELARCEFLNNLYVYESIFSKFSKIFLYALYIIRIKYEYSSFNATLGIQYFRFIS